MSTPQIECNFADLGLRPEVLSAIQTQGYETPSAIQKGVIPFLLEGRDIIGQAQTGTGKTAAFACPLLSAIDISHHAPQVLVLTPTRELAIQVSEAFRKYAADIAGFRVTPIYGGQDIHTQLKRLKSGVHVIVGTPGRVMDHIKRKSLSLSSVKTFVLDEADEMLRMGFVEDIDWILAHAPEERQIALFSATMPPAIKKIANTYLRDPEHVSIAVKTATCENITQRYCYVRGSDKLDGLTRLLETEKYEAVIVFVRTKLDTETLAQALQNRGHAAEALSGDVKQSQRERIVNRLRSGSLNIVIATDVAARGIDVDRVTHVINYDIPYDVESYIHRIGRTGRAGRTGDAILFVSPREKNMLRTIERATKQRIEEIPLPSLAKVNAERTDVFKKKIAEILETHAWEPYMDVVNSFQEENEVTTLEISAALCALLHKDAPLFMTESLAPIEREEFDEKRRGDRRRGQGRFGKARRNGDSPREGKAPRERKAGNQGKKFGGKKGKKKASSFDAAPRGAKKRKMNSRDTSHL